MKRLKVPLLPTLDVLDLSSIGFLMETKAQREYIDTANWEEYPYKPVASFDIARTDTNLYLHFFVRGNTLKALYHTEGSPVHKDSCVEFFMKTVDDHNYMNFEFNCIGTCDAARRQSREIKRSLTTDEYALIRRYSPLREQNFSQKPGLQSWDLFVCIPFTLMGIDPRHLPEKILGNFYKCADDTDEPHFVSWNPKALEKPDFHCPAFFGEIYL